MHRIVMKLLSPLKRVWSIISVVPRAIAFYNGSVGVTLKRTFRIFLREGISGILRRVNILTGVIQVSASKNNIYHNKKILNLQFQPKISIIVPNFNHGLYLRDRLDSIYTQSYSNFEVILLDDCSSDDSIKILTEYSNRYAEKTRTDFNSENSGGVFHQWKKGLSLASGDFVWIAESDDNCSPNFLEEMLSFFCDSAVMMAFAKTEFIEGDPPRTIWTLKEYLADLGIDISEEPFVKSAMDLMRLGWSTKNIIPNVSAVLFRKPVGLKLLSDADWLEMQVCGDWIFYLSIVRGGLIAYSPKATNYYRQHSENSSVKTQAREIYYREHEAVAKKILQLYPESIDCFSMQEKLLYKHWCTHRGNNSGVKFHELYSRQRITSILKSNSRMPNIAIAVYALIAGGGETFPINIANELSQRGYAVTVINFLGEKTEEGVRSMLLKSIPIINLSELDILPLIIYDLGIEIIHSHHAWVDINIATLLTGAPSVKHVVTMHGMYEMMSRAQIHELLPRLNLIDAFIYTAGKNLQTFPDEFRNKKILHKINNALPEIKKSSLSRSSFGLNAEDFVLCMVARAIPEKGWEEAIRSVVLANNSSIRSIHLILIGSGAEKERLSKIYNYDYLHFLGFQPNISDYFSLSDIGFLPTRFMGESAPLVLIECILAGRPMLASSIGEIPSMLNSEKGLAGIIFGLDNWKINVEQLSEIIIDIANDSKKYREILSRTSFAAEKFNFKEMMDKYEKIYQNVLEA